ncbi:MAG: aconitase X catalytic domain-containing protein [Nitrososphaerota archaeon]|nr:aconitase X catalytic domain-containing protein [Candidatus Bathyarchaeota archaeon]MDW8048649.1 aconitase X catalytic domain-containing protein [Nitrososphaerota archaeon]
MVHLTTEEEKILNGERGWAYQVAMKILVKLGDLYGAKRLIPIRSAHVSGVSYKTIGDAPIEFLRNLFESGAIAEVETTTNPAGFDSMRLDEFNFSESILEKQLEVIRVYEGMKFLPVLTCTPYYLRRPRKGSHLAWAESSAVVYANSILNAWTNREGGPSALAAALIGKTPDYGLHRPENRRPEIGVDVNVKLSNEAEFGALGILLGKVVRDKIPVFKGLPSLEEFCLKQMGAALASSGMVSFFYPSYLQVEEFSISDTLSVEAKELNETFERLSTTDEEPDMIFIGCPHSSLHELETVAFLLRGRKVKRGVRLWVCTSRYIKNAASAYVSQIEAAGGKVICDTCAVVTWLKEMGVQTLMTNSAKTAYYAPNMCKVGVRFASLQECINKACSGS